MSRPSFEAQIHQDGLHRWWMTVTISTAFDESWTTKPVRLEAEARVHAEAEAREKVKRFAAALRGES